MRVALSPRRSTRVSCSIEQSDTTNIDSTSVLGNSRCFRRTNRLRTRASQNPQLTVSDAYRIAKPTRCRNSAKHVLVTTINQAEHTLKPDGLKTSSNTDRIISQTQVKSPCIYPCTAATTWSISPLRNSMRGFTSSNEG